VIFYTITSLQYQKQKHMETKTTIGVTSSNFLLTGAIFLADMDLAGFADYAVKAAIGGAIWLGYKLAADFIERKRNIKK
jgi:hypothetical protein